MTGGNRVSYEEWAQISFPPDIDLVAAAVGEFCNRLQARGAAPEMVAGIRLAVVEALTNSIKHGGAEGEEDVRLRWSWRGEWLDIEVSEPGDFTPGAGWRDLPADPLAESGRGGFLMAQHSDELEHANIAGRHRLRLRKRLGVTPQEAPGQAELEATLGAMTEDLSASYETLSALFRLAEALATTEDLPGFAGHALKLRRLVEADTMHVRLHEPGGGLLLLGAAAEDCTFPQVLDPDGASVEAQVFRSGVERTTDEQTAFASDDPLRGLFGAGFVCPVYFQSRQLGVCVLGRRRSGAYFTAAQLSLARSTAEFLGIAYANAELQSQRLNQLRAQRELEIAAQIQQSLVPAHFPQRRDWRVHGRCDNATEAGGDFFDVLETPGGVLLMIADVMGKGVPAALLAVVLRTAARSHAGLARNPGQLLSRINAQIAPDLERLGMFITAQAVFLEADSKRIVYANAGHCPILALAPAGGSPRVLEEGGLPLGVAQAETYAAHDLLVRTDERIILSTDGLLEAPDEHGREWGIDGLSQAAQALQPAAPEAMCSRLLELVQQRDGARAPTDDRTLVVAQFLS
jgi:serine phosphatase RsbU (regulator of sigma subunit)/anti-sigma regulatory factor (Ser/Thr protein kinase)